MLSRVIVLCYGGDAHVMYNNILRCVDCEILYHDAAADLYNVMSINQIVLFKVNEYANSFFNLVLKDGF